MEFEVYYREDKSSRPITYELSIDLDRDGRVYVAKERLGNGVGGIRRDGRSPS
jgi:hypothetical protein